MQKLIAEEAGVRLIHYDSPPTKSSGKGGEHYKLKTMRLNLPRVFVDRAEAELAYEREVRASWEDPVIAKLVKRLR